MDFLTDGGAAIWAYARYPISFVLVLSLVVFVHEYGHFIVGRWCGVGVTRFSIGFGPELFGFTDRHGTRWRFALLPLGGYVKFVGDASVASNPDHAAIAAMDPAERSQSFFLKPVWQRALIVFAGPLANFLMAIAIFAGSIYVGGRMEPRIGLVQPGSRAAEAGLRAGDLITSIDGRSIDSFTDLQRVVGSRPNEALEVTLVRDGAPLTVTATPALREMKTPLGRHRTGLLGIGPPQGEGEWQPVRYGLLQSVGKGIDDTVFIVDRTFAFIGGLFAGRETTDQLSGPIRIAYVSGEVSSGGFAALLSLAAVLSVSIGLMNLFPVPMLDGGHLVFYAYEALRGRPLSERAQEYSFRVGLALVVALMLFVTFNDIIQLKAL